MSKMDALRAMREARYAQSATPTARPTARPSTPPVAPTPVRTARPAASSAPAETPAADDAEALCGHRNMGGRTCTREQGHAAKSHRYS